MKSSLSAAGHMVAVLMALPVLCFYLYGILAPPPKRNEPRHEMSCGVVVD